MIIEKLIDLWRKWTKDKLVKPRLQNLENGYTWCGNAIGFKGDPGTPDVKQFQDFFDRKTQNDEYVKRYNKNHTPSPVKEYKQFAWYQDEINMIYSFHKCFAMRHRRRLEYYRSDLSQKGARTRSAVNLSLAKFINNRNFAER